MKVLHLIAPIRFGGGESLLLNLLGARQPGIDEEVACLYRSDGFEARLRAIHVPVWRLRDRNIGDGISKRAALLDFPAHVVRLPALARLIGRRRVDVVHAHGFPASLLFGLARWLTPVRGVYTHHFVRDAPSGLERRLLGAAYRSFAACTGVSQLVTGSMIRAFPVVAGRFTTIHDCVGDRFYDASPDRAFAATLAPGRRNFVQVGRFSAFKNQHLVVEALARMPEALRRSLTVIFIGEGVERARVEQRASGLGVLESTRFLGAVAYEKLPGILAACDFGLFPSENEGFGLGAAECLACGLPVLSLDNQLMGEVVGPGGIRVARESLDEGFRLMVERGDALRETARRQAALYRVGAIKDRYATLYRQVTEPR